MWDPIVSSLKVFSFNFDYNLMFPNNPYETCTFLAPVVLYSVVYLFTQADALYRYRLIRYSP